VFGFSFGEFLLICVVALVAVGPKKLPTLLGTLGKWIRKARTMLHDMRAQSGIDDILRNEGLHGGLNELRGLVRAHASFPAEIMASVAGAASAATGAPGVPGAPVPPVAPTGAAPSHFGSSPVSSLYDPYGGVDIDPTKEYPPEGADAYGALPDDLASEIAPYPLPGAATVAVTDTPWHSEPTPAAAAESAAEPEAPADAKPADDEAASRPRTAPAA